MFDDLSEQHIVSLILDSCPYGLKNVYKYKYKYKSSCILHLIRLIPTNTIIALIKSNCASTTTKHQYLIYPCTTILFYPQVDCAINHYYHDSEGAWGAFGCDGAWPPGLIMNCFRAKRINHEFAAYMDWIVNNNYGKIQVKLFTILLKPLPYLHFITIISDNNKYFIEQIRPRHPTHTRPVWAAAALQAMEISHMEGTSEKMD